MSNETIIVFLLILILIAFVVAFFLIKPSGKQYCHIAGCNQGFNTLEELLVHYKKTHRYNSAQIFEQKKFRKQCD